MRHLFFCLAVALVGCTGATAVAGAATALQSTITVIRDVRSLVCTSKLDPFFGNPRDGEETYAPVSIGPKDGSADATDAAEVGP